VKVRENYYRVQTAYRTHTQLGDAHSQKPLLCTIIWNVTPCSFVDRYQGFRKTAAAIFSPEECNFNFHLRENRKSHFQFSYVFLCEMPVLEPHKTTGKIMKITVS
jgi:hypothetical protein